MVNLISPQVQLNAFVDRRQKVKSLDGKVGEVLVGEMTIRRSLCFSFFSI